MERPSDDLARLARAYGVQLDYRDARDRQRAASADALTAVLRAMGAPIVDGRDANAALRERELRHWERPLEPVAVAWQGQAASVPLHRASDAPDRVRLRLDLEGGGAREWTADLAELEPESRHDIEARSFRRYAVPVPFPLPPGYHRVRADGVDESTLLLSAPPACWPGTDGDARTWGAFLPLYALRTERGIGMGTIPDLARLIDWTESLGGRFVGTLPLLAAFLDEPFEPSPYSPVSRCFWNELYVDPEAASGLTGPGAAGSASRTDAWQEAARALRGRDLVDYREAARLRRIELEPLAEAFFSSGGEDSPAYRHFLQLYPDAETYARFRAVGEHQREGWPAWPERQRGGDLRSGDYDPAAARYHLFAQWAAHRQLSDLSNRESGGLYLDLPLGVHSDGYDVWRDRAIFATGVSAGAPPDPFFTGGQDWGFPPVDPHAARERGHRYTIRSLRTHLRYARILRLDHVMALHRLFWVPHGMDATDGVYVRYPAEELYAILAIESHRHRSILVGEDLGTVPDEVREAMERRHVRRMHVAQFEVRADPDAALPAAPSTAVASLNTHDMPPFAAWVDGRDLRRHVDLGFLTEAEAEEEADRRRKQVEALARFLDVEPEPRALLDGVLDQLGSGAAAAVLVGLEDLWLETEPQNVPGTWREVPNWRRRAAPSFDEIRDAAEVVGALRRLTRARERKIVNDDEAETHGE